MNTKEKLSIKKHGPQFKALRSILIPYTCKNRVESDWNIEWGGQDGSRLLENSIPYQPNGS